MGRHRFTLPIWRFGNISRQARDRLSLVFLTTSKFQFIAKPGKRLFPSVVPRHAAWSRPLPH
jgi:hypothetical protein